MTALDILVLLLVGGLGLRGFSTGFTTEILSLVAWVVGIVAVKVLHTPVANMLEAPVGTAAGASVLAFALVFGIPFLIGRFIAKKVGTQFKQSAVGPIDRVLGFGFGAIKGVIGASLVFLFATLIYDTIYGGHAKRPQWMLQSRTYPLLNASSRALVEFVDDRRKGGADAPEAPSTALENGA
jgi:membrane protein required for colicin V production